MADEFERGRPDADLPTDVALSDGPLALVQLDGTFAYVSDGFCRVVGRTREELVGRRADESGIAGSERVQWIMDRAPEVGSAYAYRRAFLTPLGERPVEVVIHRATSDLLAVTLTEETREGPAGRPADRVLGSILDAIPVGVVVYDSDLRIVRVNRTVEEMGRIRPEHLGQRVTDALPDVEETLLDAIRSVLDTGEKIVNHQITRPDGQTFLLNYFPIRAEDGRVDQVGCLFSDVTAFTAAQQVIRSQQEAIRELSTPILELADGLLVVPLVGTIDPTRARTLTEQLLAAVLQFRAMTIILDVTGVPVVDSVAVHHLVQAAQAARLMGAHTIFSGISVDHAAALARLGIDLGEFEAVGSLSDALSITQASQRQGLAAPALGS